MKRLHIIIGVLLTGLIVSSCSSDRKSDAVFPPADVEVHEEVERDSTVQTWSHPDSLLSDFYYRYLRYDWRMSSVPEGYLSDRLQLALMVSGIDWDPFINGQDNSPFWIEEEPEFRPISEDGFTHRVILGPSSENPHEIFLRVSKINGDYRIDSLDFMSEDVLRTLQLWKDMNPDSANMFLEEVISHFKSEDWDRAENSEYYSKRYQKAVEVWNLPGIPLLGTSDWGPYVRTWNYDIYFSQEATFTHEIGWVSEGNYWTIPVKVIVEDGKYVVDSISEIDEDRMTAINLIGTYVLLDSLFDNCVEAKVTPIEFLRQGKVDLDSLVIHANMRELMIEEGDSLVPYIPNDYLILESNIDLGHLAYVYYPEFNLKEIELDWIQFENTSTKCDSIQAVLSSYSLFYVEDYSMDVIFLKPVFLP
ncbi:hypothetical protein [Phaeocystidibacter luteus]|uniref:Uncharacterized protein n=1 Tax=Phaeocystidibacter luteus TaxID=911197 RepID=A0A6N6RH97_9FLAO|nr:hypothetical protein [Phaeocystidibacter luteus]KAB2813749.1 hypothetical protein F8C67_06210 [Phaeocystidibacter luteus]